MVMVQAEVAERLAAEPGGKDYGVPSVKVRFFGNVRRYGMVSPTVFWPIPRVYSGLVRIDRYETSPWPTDAEFREQVFELIDIAFAQRRKTSRNAFVEWAGSGNESAEPAAGGQHRPVPPGRDADRRRLRAAAAALRGLARHSEGGTRGGASRPRNPQQARSSRRSARSEPAAQSRPRAASSPVRRCGDSVVRCPLRTEVTASEWVPTGSVTVRVPGKVNLYLEVGDRRDDGYHELTTVFHAVSLLDEVTVRTADVLSLELVGEGAESLPTDERNLAWQAAELMAEHVGRAPDVAITIEKSIPVAGGMAGGSADAAAVLVAMNALWELGVPRRDLHTLAAQLGSDVPFALHGGTALGTGRGEELATVLARNTFHWVLAFAASGLSTPRSSPRSTGCGPPGRQPAAAAGRSRTGAGRAGLRGSRGAGAAARQRPAAGGAEPRPGAAPHAARRGRGRRAGRHRVRLGPDLRVPVRLGGVRRSTSAPSWPAPASAARCGWPAGRCTAPGSYRPHQRPYPELCMRPEPLYRSPRL